MGRPPRAGDLVRIPVVGLLGRLGQRRDLVRAVPPIEFGDDPWGASVDRLDGDVRLDLVLEAVSGGIVVRGTVAASPVVVCARCLALTPTSLEVEVVELHRAARTAEPRGSGGRRDPVDVGDEELDEDDLAYQLVDGDTALDLDGMVRDALVTAQPVRVLCRPDCRGLCPDCGADLNEAPCAHGRAGPVDPRWEALRDLRLAPPSERG
jgi:uncharacterized protein